MKKTLLFVTVLALALCTLASVHVTRAADEAAEDTHRAAAKKVFDQMDVKEVFMSGFMVGVEPTLNQMKQAGLSDAKIQQIRGVFVQFGNTIANDPELVDRLVSMYTELFSEKELNDIAGFYQTDTGKKFLKVTPLLTQKSSMAGQQVAGKYQAQLEQQIKAILQPPAPATEPAEPAEAAE